MTWWGVGGENTQQKLNVLIFQDASIYAQFRHICFSPLTDRPTVFFFSFFLYGKVGRCADNFHIVVVCRNKVKHIEIFV